MAAKRASRAASVLATALLAFGFAASAQAATPTFWDDRMEFEAELTASVMDDYTNAAYVFIQDDATMSGVVGETDYSSTGFNDLNIITNMAVDPRYCAGCNGSFELSFLTTSVGTANGVDAVGFDVDSHAVATPYYAYITYADGTTDDIIMPAGGNFWGVSAPEQIERIHIGFSMGVTTTMGSISIDDLTVGTQGPQLCGNGELDEGEDCDDAGESATCDSNCTFVACPDNNWNATAGEECDTGGDSATCDADCTLVVCGDLYVNTEVEDCDDGLGETAECDLDCTTAACGDGTWNVTAGEDCDDGGDSATCDADCTPAVCGDGTANAVALEDCDDAGESATCNDDCTTATCGDGVLNTTAGETCDDAGKSEDCDVDCTAVTCGDGLVNLAAGEECDGDGKGTPGQTSTCDEDCTTAICGDGVVNEMAGEECDDGNMSDGDGCASLCWEEAASTGMMTTGSTGDDTTGGGDPTGPDPSGPDETGSSGAATTTPLPVDPEPTDGDGASTGGTGGSAMEGDSGCGCTAAPGRGGLLAFVLFGIAAAGRRRRAL